MWGLGVTRLEFRGRGIGVLVSRGVRWMVATATTEAVSGIRGNHGSPLPVARKRTTGGQLGHVGFAPSGLRAGENRGGFPFVFFFCCFFIVLVFFHFRIEISFIKYRNNT